MLYRTESSLDMKDRQRLKEVRKPHPFILHFLRELQNDDDIITIHCDTRNFNIWGQVKENIDYLIPEERKIAKMHNIDPKYLINSENVYEFLFSIYKLTGYAGIRRLVCYNLEKQNRKTFWCLKYLHFIKYADNPDFFICTDRAYNLLNPSLINQSNIDILASWIIPGSSILQSGKSTH